MVTALRIGRHLIGPDQRTFIIAEAGVNHNGDLKIAMKLIDAAAEARADAVKFQTFSPDRLVSRTAPKADYQKKTTGTKESQWQMLQRLALSEADHRALFAHCRRRGILFLSTPFDEASADFLEQLGVPAFKIASGDLTNWPLLAHVASKGKPMILSTGMATLGETQAAVRIIRSKGRPSLAVLHCISNYPTQPEDANLRAMATLARSLKVPIGFSDHTEGLEVPWAAVALGACILEKHFTLDRGMPGPDHRASLLPKELKELVRGIRVVEKALGHGRKMPTREEIRTAAVARKSLTAKRPIERGSRLQRTQIELLRPGTGLPASMLPRLLGRRAKVGIPAGAMLKQEMFS